MKSNLSVKKGDKVLVLTGKDSGKVGEVLTTFPQDSRVQVKGVNIMSRHKKPRNQREKGGIFRVESTIDVSNVQVVCPHCGKATRVANTFNEKGTKSRTCKKCGASLDTGRRVSKKTAAKEVEVNTEKEVKAEPAKKATIRDAERNSGNIKTTSAKTNTAATKTRTAGRSGK